MTEPSAPPPGFTRSVLLAVGIGAAVLIAILLVQQIADVLLMFFGAILVAVLLDAPARMLESRVRVPHPLGVCLVTAASAGVVLLLGWLGEPQVAAQLDSLVDRLPGAWRSLKDAVEETPWGRTLLREADQVQQPFVSPSAWIQRIGGVFSGTLGAITNTAVMLVVGFYLAFQPGLYTSGIVRLVPPSRRNRAREVLGAVGRALRWWLVGRLISMASIGVLTTLALWMIDMPLALGLGFVAGLFSFVPFIGPIVSAIPAVLLALPQGPLQVVSVIVIYAAAQFIEGNIVTPITQERVVALAPAVLLLSQVLIGSMFGIMGLLLATPLAVVLIVLVQMLYIEDTLRDRIHVLGE